MLAYMHTYTDMHTNTCTHNKTVTIISLLVIAGAPTDLVFEIPEVGITPEASKVLREE